MKREDIFVFYEEKYRSIWYDHRYDYDKRQYNDYYCLEGKNKKFETLEPFKDCKFYVRKYKKGRYY